MKFSTCTFLGILAIVTAGNLACAQFPERADQRRSEVQTAEQAKRRIEYVEPVVKNGVRYEELRGAKSRGFGQNGGILVATDDKTGEELWTLQIYETKYDPREEADVQDVFFKELSASWFGSKLTIVNERGKTFVVNIKDRSVTE